MKQLDQLWNTSSPTAAAFEAGLVDCLPDSAARYLRHGIAPGTPLATAVRLRMRGSIKLGKWGAFSAEQVIHRERGIVWHARTRMFGLPVSGYDRIVDAAGEMRWTIAGRLPIVSGAGSDITRSAAGRWKGELIWLPSALVGVQVAWSTPEPNVARAEFALAGEAGGIDYFVRESGALRAVKFTRWGNPDGGAYAYHEFGALIEAEETFGGYTVPTSVRVGWHFDGAAFRNDGEFFRATVAEAVYR